jgi:chromosome segregation ATPase
MVWVLVPVILYAVFMTYIVWNLIGDYAELQEREERQSQRIAKVMEQRSHYEQLATKNAALVDELEKDMAESTRQLEIVSNQYDDVQNQRVDLAKQKDDMHAELINVRRALANMKDDLVASNLLAAQRLDQLARLQEEFDEQGRTLNQIRDLCNT